MVVSTVVVIIRLPHTAVQQMLVKKADDTMNMWVDGKCRAQTDNRWQKCEFLPSRPTLYVSGSNSIMSTMGHLWVELVSNNVSASAHLGNETNYRMTKTWRWESVDHTGRTPKCCTSGRTCHCRSRHWPHPSFRSAGPRGGTMCSSCLGRALLPVLAGALRRPRGPHEQRGGVQCSGLSVRKIQINHVIN